MKIDKTQSVWYERYKPQTLADVILPKAVKEKLQSYIIKHDIPNLGLWSVEPGLGKSSTATPIINCSRCEALWLYASLERGIDAVRGKIHKFASQQSFDDGLKIVVMDESDNISQEGQAAFRGFLDEFSKTCRFIFTGNYKSKVIEPLLDRLMNIEFGNFDKKEMIVPVFERLCFILESEQIKYDKQDIKKVIKIGFPKIRSMVGFLQKSCTNGEFKLDETSLDDNIIFDEILKSRSKSFVDLVSMVNQVKAPDEFYSYLYKNALKYFAENVYPNVILICAKYQHMASSVRDKNLNLCACIAELSRL